MNLHRFNMICADHHGEGMSPCVFPELHARTGQWVDVLTPTLQADDDLLWHIRFVDGWEHDAFDCELI